MAEINKTIQIDLTTNAKEISAQIDVVQNNIANLEKQIKETKKELEKQTKIGDTQAITDLTQKIELQQKELKSLNAEYNNLNKTVNVFENANQNTVSGLNEIISALKSQRDNVDFTTKEYKDLTSQINQFENKLKSVTSSTEETSEATKSLKQQYREAVAELGKFEEGTKGYQEAAARAGALADQIEKNNIAIKANKSGVDALVGSLQGVAGGFAVVQGAAGLFGSENENVQKALLKVQSALAIVQGIDAFSDNISNVKIFGQKIVSATASVFGFGKATEVAAVETAALGEAGAVAGTEVAVGMEEATVATEGFAASLTATGIGAIIVGIGVAIGLIAAYWDDIKSAISGVSAEQENNLKIVQKNTTKQQEALDILNSQDETLKASGKSENEILELKRKQTLEVLKAKKEELIKQQEVRKAQIETAERNKSILQNIIRLVTLPLTALLAGIDLVGKAFGQNFNLEQKFSGGLASLVFDPEDMKKQGEKTDKEAKKGLIELQNTADGYANKEKENRKKSAEDAKKKADEINKTIQDLQKKHNQEMLKLNKDYDDRKNKAAEADAKTNVKAEEARLDTTLSNIKYARQQELDALQERRDAIAKLEADGVKENDKRLIQLKTGLKQEEKKINDKYALDEENAWKTYGDNINNILRQDAATKTKLRLELNGTTYELLLKQLNQSLALEKETLIKAGFSEEEIEKLFNKRRIDLRAEFDKNSRDINNDKKYFDDLHKIYSDNTLTEKQRNKAIEKAEEERFINGIASNQQYLEEKRAQYPKDSKEYQDYTNQLVDNDNKRLEHQLKNEEKARNARKKSYEEAKKLATGLADLASALLDGETKRIEKEYAKRSDALKKQTEKQLANQELTDAQKEELQRQAAIKEADIEKEKADKLKEIQKQQADIQLAITLAQIIASTAEAVMAVTAKEAEAAPFLIPLIIANGAVQAATAIAQRANVQGLAKGGMVYGDGTSTSDSIPAMLSNGEAVINAKAVKRFAPVLSAINQSTGGAPIRPHFAAGGVVTANPGEVSITNIQDIAAITGQNAVRAYILQSDVTSSSVKNQRILRNSRFK